MSADEFCCGMNNDICAVLNWANQVWGCKCIVDYQRNLMLMSDICQCLDIHYIRVRVTKCLNVKCFCIVLDCCFYFVNIKRIYKCSLDAVLRKCVLQQVEGTTINIFCCYDMISGLSKIFNGISNRCRSGSYC